MRATFLIGFYFSFLLTFPQKPLRDSLIKEIETYPTVDSVYIDMLNELSFEYIKSDPAQALPYINKTILLADSIQYTSGLIRATMNKGSSFWVVGLQDQALTYYLQAISRGAQNYPLDYARLNNNIGEVYKKKKLYDSAINHYYEAKRAAILVDQKPVIITCNLAEAFLLNNQIDSAEFYFTIGLEFANQINHQRGLANAYSGLSEINFLRGNVLEAIRQQYQSLKLGELIEDVRGVIQRHLKLSEYYLFIKQLDSADYHMLQSKTLSEGIRANDLLLDASYLQYQILTTQGRYQQASQVLDSYQLLKDSIVSLEFSSNVDRMKSSLLAEISSKENQLLIQEQKEVVRVNRIRLIFISIVSFLGIIVLFLTYFFRETRRQLKHQSEKDALIDKLSLRNKNLREFNSVISHNLREPLTQIIGYSKFYENKNVDIPTDDIIKNIRRSSFKIDQTIRDLSTVLNEVEPDSKDYKTIHFDETIQDVVDSFDEKLIEIKPNITLNVIPENLKFRSYRPFIRDIFHHLISNSIRFRNKENELSIKITIEQAENETFISFQDNGIGMDIGKAKGKIFKMYQKFHLETPGRGIGLYIVKNRVDLLRGEISVHSEIGTGTTFNIILPVN